MMHLLLCAVCFIVVTTSLPGAIAVVIPGILSFSETCRTSTVTIDGDNVSGSTCLIGVTTTTPISWVEAQSKCNQYWNGAKLVTINDADKNNAVLGAAPPTHGCWIGLVDMSGGGPDYDWRNSDLQTQQYFNWSSAAPTTLEVQRCGFMYGNGFFAGEYGQWDNNFCNGNTPGSQWAIKCFMCESTALQLDFGGPVMSQ